MKLELQTFLTAFGRRKWIFNRPSDRVRKKIKNYVEIFRQYYAEESDDYAEKTPDYAEISKLIKLLTWRFSNV